MKYVSCGSCNDNRVPMNTSVTIDGVVYCENCLNARFPNEASLRNSTITRTFDPTVCTNCQRDNGEMSYPTIGEYPMCGDCSRKLEERIMPRWVKAFFAAVIVLVIVSFVWNLRFIKAYYALKSAESAIQEGDLETISRSFAAVTTNVPELKEFVSLAAYFRGINLMSQDKSEEALEAFKLCTDLDSDYNVGAYITQAEIGAAADNKDFRRFVVAANKYLLYDTSATAYVQVASAYSCLYAAERNDSIKTLSRLNLMKARLKNDTTDAFRFYASMVEYRLASGDPISREDFTKLFPNGWTPN